MIKKSDWQATYRDLIAEGRTRLGEPPAEEEILAYFRGELAEKEAARVRELLAYYPELARALQGPPLPESYDGKPSDADFLSDEELARDWASLQARVLASESKVAASAASAGAWLEPLPAVGVASEIFRRQRRPDQELRLWRLSTVAAALLAVVFGGLYSLAQWTVQRMTQELREPRFNLEHRLLLPDGQRGSVQRAIPLSSEADYFLLTPALINQPQYPDYRLEIVDSSLTPPRPIWSGTGLRRRSDDTFAVWIPRSFLKPGKYKLVLYGIEGRRNDLLSTYTVRLSPK
jgi:hypothetical protein